MSELRSISTEICNLFQGLNRMTIEQSEPFSSLNKAIAVVVFLVLLLRQRVVLVPAGSLVAGVPAKIKRKLSEEERKKLKGWAEKYLVVAKAHREKLATRRPGPPA